MKDLKYVISCANITTLTCKIKMKGDHKGIEIISVHRARPYEGSFV